MLFSKVEQLAQHYHKTQAGVWGLDRATEDTKRFTALGSDDWGGGLRVGGDGGGLDSGDWVRGVRESNAEGVAQNKAPTLVQILISR
jgi:hypothetical protein